MCGVDMTRFGADVRLLRIRKGWTQGRLAEAAGVRRWVIVEVETGRGHRIRIELLAAIVIALGGRISVRVLYQGEGLDRLRDQRHAALVEAIVRRLRAAGWDVATEVSFNVYGERGSIDVLAVHPETGSLLVIEVKSVVPDVGGMLMTLDRKVRLAPDIATRQLGWRVTSVSKLLVLPEGRTVRRRVDDHAETFAAALPARTVAVKGWLARPMGALAGVLFLSDVQHVDQRRRAAARTGRRRA
jgi:transcriptional regulator with XRE-family HTH domain